MSTVGAAMINELLHFSAESGCPATCWVAGSVTAMTGVIHNSYDPAGKPFPLTSSF